MFRTCKTRALLAAVLIAGCAAVTPDLPSITESPTGERYVGKVVWHDLLTSTPVESRHFYGELFGWTFEEPGIDIGIGGSAYMLIRHNGQLIGGMVDANALDTKEDVSQWITMMSVGDVNAAVAAATKSGGTILREPTSLKSRGTLAIIEDPSGAVFALLQTKDGDPADREPEVNGFLWDELWTVNVAQAGQFYTDVLGFEHEDRDIEKTEDPNDSYHLLKSGDKPRAGILINPYKDVRPVWVNYLRVEDPAAITARVEDLGGQILLDTQQRDIGGEVAFVTGPSGAGIALQTWPLDPEQ